MLTCILVIAGVVIAISGIVAFFSDSFSSISEVLSYANSSIDGFLSLFPDWLYAFVLVGLAVAVVSLIVKLI